ncbi:MAG: hypothetical protein ACREBJ_04875, partial [Nitrosotalea sp.]
ANKYSAIINIWDPDGSIRVAPLYGDQSVEVIVEDLRKSIKGARFSSALISDILIGELCYRRFDNMYSSYYENLIKSGAIKRTELANYQ